MNKKLLIFCFFNLSFFTFHANGELKKSYKQSNFDSQNVSKERYTPRTKISGNLIFTLGALESPHSSESLHATYENKVKLNTSFDGTDNLLTIIESGNASNSPLNLDLQSKKGETLKISTLLYQFKIKDNTKVIVGPMMFGYHGLAGKSTAYNERIAILDGSNYTTATGLGPGLGISTKKKNGFNTSIKLASNQTIIDDESMHLISQIGITKRNFGGTITNNLNKKFNAYGLAAFYKPKKLPSISISIEQKDDNSIKNTYNWIFALQKNFQNKTFGLAIGTHNENEKIAYEGWSEIEISDNFKFIPILFKRENNERRADLGFSLNTKFSY
tara:strand:+ start:5202 stop:6191 length:990 start_codon:yes stop_codon:yes gene_type:complete